MALGSTRGRRESWVDRCESCLDSVEPWRWVSHLASLSLGVLLCTMGIITHKGTFIKNHGRDTKVTQTWLCPSRALVLVGNVKEIQATECAKLGKRRGAPGGFIPQWWSGEGFLEVEDQEESETGQDRRISPPV